jgi:hypothetical protein
MWSRRAMFFQAPLIGKRLLDGTLEEARVVAHMQHCEIGKA